MKIVRFKVRLFLVSLMVALPLAGITQALAQEQEFTPEAYTSTLSGYNIAVSGPEYRITSAVLEHYSPGEGEIVTIEAELATLEVSFFDDADTPDESIDAYLAGLENAEIDYTVVDRGEMGEITYAIVTIDYDGIDLLYYVHVTADETGNVDLFETILSTPHTFLEDFSAAQQEVTVGGAPFMAEADGTAILATADPADGDTVAASPVAELPATTVTFANADVELGIGDEFGTEVEPVADGSIEGYVITGPDTVNMVAIGETGMAAADTVSSFAAGLESTYTRVREIESRESGDTAWSLYEVESTGELRIVLVVGDTAMVPGYELLVAIDMPLIDVPGSILAVQNGLSLDGQPLLATIDVAQIDALVDGDRATESTPTIRQQDTTPAGTADAGGGSGSPRDQAKLPAGSGNTPETTTTPEAASTPSPSTGSATNGGGRWEGPLLGHVLEWDRTVWTTDLDDPAMVTSDEVEQLESIVLTAEVSPIPSFLYVDMYAAGGGTPADYLAYWTSDEFLMSENDAGQPWNAQIVASRSSEGRVAVVVAYSNDDGDFMLVQEAVVTNSGGIILLSLDAPAADLGDAYAAAQAGVTVDGAPLFSVFSQSQIERAAGD